MKMATTSKQWLCAFILLAFSGGLLAHPNERFDINANYATGVTVGENSGTGLFIRKYFDRNYAQMVGRYSYGEYEPVSSLAFTVGRYFYQEKLSAIEFPVGMHYFLSVNGEYNHKKDYEDVKASLYPGIGLAIDFFNPGTKGIGSSFSIAYGSRMWFFGDSYELNRVYLGAVFASASLVYNW
jgi:hypothetical protein